MTIICFLALQLWVFFFQFLTYAMRCDDISPPVLLLDDEFLYMHYHLISVAYVYACLPLTGNLFFFV